MRSSRLLPAGGLIAALLFAGPLSAANDDSTALALMGDYTGSWNDPQPKGEFANNPNLAAQVIVLDDSKLRLRLVPQLLARCPEILEAEMPYTAEGAKFKDAVWDITVTKDEILATCSDKKVGPQPATFTLKKDIRLSPTMGAKPPKGATVLFDGSHLDAWQHADGRPPAWKVNSREGWCEVVPGDKTKKNDLLTKQNFSDCRLHIEFQTPLMLGQYGQARANSGVFFMGLYEVQVLDSYGLDGLWNECGALYKVAAPKVNAALPPGTWQTYDIEFHGPRFKDGKKIRNARASVLLNGVPVHTDTEIPHPTAHSQKARGEPEPTEPGPIKLQDHGNQPRFRNIWIEPLKGS